MFARCQAKCRDSTFMKALFIATTTLLAALVIALVVMIICYFTIRPVTPDPCGDEKCLRSAADLQLSMAQTRDPCDDFYAYACGGWTERNPNLRWVPMYSSFDEMKDYIVKSAVKVMTTAKYERSKAIQKVRKLYESCMDIDTLNALGIAPIEKHLKELGFPMLPNFFTLDWKAKESFKFDWLLFEAKIKRLLVADVFVGFSFHKNFEKWRGRKMYVYRMLVDWPSRVSPLPNFEEITTTVDTEDFENMEKIIQKSILYYTIEIISEGAKIQFPPEIAIDQAAETIIKIKQTIAKIKEKHGARHGDVFCPYLENYDALFNSRLKYFGTEYPGIWQRFTKYMAVGGGESNLNLAGETLCVHDQAHKYLIEIVNYVMRAPAIEIELYMWWITVNSMILNTGPNVTRNFYPELDKSMNSFLLKARSLACTRIAITFMGRAVAFEVADEYIELRQLTQVQKLLNTMEEGFQRALLDNKFMAKITRNELLDSIHVLWRKFKLNWLWDWQFLDKLYRRVETNKDTFIDNMLNFTRNYFPAAFKQLEYDFDHWDVQEYISLDDETIYVIMAALTYPLYNLEQEAISYATIGFTTAHELIVNFAKLGQVFKKNDNYEFWWNKDSVTKWEDRSKCFEEQYKDLLPKLVAEKIDGTKWLTQHMVDQGALRLALNGFKIFLDDQREESDKLPGLEKFSDHQLFFLSYANIMCQTLDDRVKEINVGNLERAPNRIRVVGTLQNFEEFKTAFNCPSGSLMNSNSKECDLFTVD